MYHRFTLILLLLLTFQHVYGDKTMQPNHLNVEALPCCDAIPARFNSHNFEENSGMVWIPGGNFIMGGEVVGIMKEWPYIARSRNDERPVHTVQLSGFWISETPITNREFKEFVSHRL